MAKTYLERSLKDQALYLEVTVSQTAEGILVFACEGEMDEDTVKALETAFTEHLAAGEGVLINLVELQNIDSAGLVVLIRAYKRVRELGAKIVFVCTDPHLLKIFNILGLMTNVFEIYQTDMAALAALGGGH